MCTLSTGKVNVHELKAPWEHIKFSTAESVGACLLNIIYYNHSILRKQRGKQLGTICP